MLISPNDLAPAATDSPPLRFAMWCDLDLDGHTDILGLSDRHKPIVLQGDGSGKFAKRNEPFGPRVEAMADLLAVSLADFNDDRNPDLLGLVRNRRTACISERG